MIFDAVEDVVSDELVDVAVKVEVDIRVEFGIAVVSLAGFPAFPFLKNSVFVRKNVDGK